MNKLKRENTRSGCVAFCIVVILMILNRFWLPDFGKKKVEKSEIKDKIVRMYQNKYDHLEPIFVTSNGEKIYASRWRTSYDYANVGDSIIKEAGSLTLTIKKDNGEYKIFEHYKK